MQKKIVVAGKPITRQNIAKAASYVARRVERSGRKVISRRRVSLDKLLWGGDNGLSPFQLCKLGGDMLRASTPLARTPHVEFLELYDRLGEDALRPDVFRETRYYKNAFLNVDCTGKYFAATSADEIVHVARRFADQYRGVSADAQEAQPGQSAPSAPITVIPIRDSDCFTISDGHHRLARMHMAGIKEVSAVAIAPAWETPLLTLLSNVLWLNGRRELYQPIDAPEVQSNWTLVRKCSDRLEKMSSFVDQYLGTGSRSGKTYLDVGANYGWFVSKMRSLGFDSHGVERDPIASEVGHLAYGLPKDCIDNSEASRFLAGVEKPYDVVSCFSVLHHFVMGNGPVDAVSLIKLLDRSTGSVLFLDTGEGHEEWYRQRLAEWDPDYIQNWLGEHTTFRGIHRLGIDEDAVPPFEKNNGRMLFACVR